MNRAVQDSLQERKLFESSSTIKCRNCKVLFPLEYVECPRCEINSSPIKKDFEFSGGLN